MTLAEFLTWERAQPGNYEFDGVQPVAMAGCSLRQAGMALRWIAALRQRLDPPFEVSGPHQKVLAAGGKGVRCPSVTIASGIAGSRKLIIRPVIVFDVTGPADEYQQTPSVLAFVGIDVERRVVRVVRRWTGWATEDVGNVLQLPEVGIVVPLAEVV